MNNEFNRNTRTLIVGFVVAIMALIPMRFIEAGQEMASYVPFQVLGETTEVRQVVKKVEPLEAPYNVIEKTPCLKLSEANQINTALKNRISQQELSRAELDEVLSQMAQVDSLVCR